MFYHMGPSHLRQAAYIWIYICYENWRTEKFTRKNILRSKAGITLFLGSWWYNQVIQPTNQLGCRSHFSLPLFLNFHALSVVSGLILVEAEADSIITKLYCRMSIPNQEEDTQRPIIFCALLPARPFWVCALSEAQHSSTQWSLRHILHVASLRKPILHSSSEGLYNSEIERR